MTLSEEINLLRMIQDKLLLDQAIVASGSNLLLWYTSHSFVINPGRANDFYRMGGEPYLSCRISQLSGHFS